MNERREDKTLIASASSSTGEPEANHGGRTVIAHVDDVGMCHGANVAFEELSGAGLITCGSGMVPCPWFSEAAALAARDPSLDLGVHLTLNSEKRPYRWRPLTGAGTASGLIDESGHMWPDVESLRRNVVPEAAEEELRAQIERALAAGIDVTHLDAHMGAVMAPELVDVYLALGRDYRLPIVFPRTVRHYDIKHNLGDLDDDFYDAKAAQAQAEGQVLFDRIFETPWRPSKDRHAVYGGLFEAVPEGLSFFALHPNAPGEFEFIEPAEASVRVGEYDLFRDRRFLDLIESLNLDFIGFRRIREVYQARLES